MLKNYPSEEHSEEHSKQQKSNDFLPRIEIGFQSNISDREKFFLNSRYPHMDISDAFRFNAKRRPLIRKVDEWLFTQLGAERSLNVKLRLVHLKKQIFRLSTWRGWLGLILRPLLILLGENAYWYFQKFLYKIEKREVYPSFSPNEVAKGKNVVAQLKSNGIANWEGMFSDNIFLREGKQTAQILLEKAHKKLEERPGRVGDIYEVSTGHRFIRAHPVEYCGRTRVRLGWTVDNCDEKMPSWMDLVVNEKRLLQVAENVFGVPVSIKRYTIDYLSPSQTSLEWHIDTVQDCLKTFILLDDCNPENGYTQLRIGSHQLDTPLIRRTYFLLHKYGAPYQYPPPIDEVCPGEIAKGIGKAGDAIFFNNKALHSATACIAGVRIVLIVSYNIHSSRNKMLAATGIHG